MKKGLFFFIAMLFCIAGFSQGLTGINYQAIARNLNGTVLDNKPVQVRFTITQGGVGAPQYQETQNAVTNAYGLFNLVIGKGTPVTGTFAAIPWSAANQWLEVEVAVSGGPLNSLGKNPFYAVPFAVMALSANPVGPAGGDLLGSTYPNPVIAPLAVTTGKIADAAVTTVKLADGSVTTAKIVDQNVTTAKLADASVTTVKLADASVTTVKLADGAVTTQKITFPLIKVQSDAGALIEMTNSGAGAGISGINTGTGFGGLFSVNNPASTFDGIRATTNGTGASWAIRAISSGTNGAGLFQQTNATNTSNNVQSNQAGLGRAGLFQLTNAANTANALEATTNGTGFALRAASTNASPKALLTAGALQLTGIGEAANRVLISDATGNATWQSVAAAGAITGSGTLNFVPKWTPGSAQLGNSLLFDDGSAVALGTTTPTHRFTVSHGGSTGIGVSSTSGFSVVDIDAQSGDAALRFARAGVNQWNVRNRPADDYFEIFELGGGGSRLVIQDATGNVGIGETTNPAYKLDVLHGGSTGIRSRSSSSFSVVDIDAASGDAALRFQKAGVNQWNTRNRPADDYYEIFELGGGGSRFVIQDATGNVGIGETTNPVYKLDVLHGGGLGARVRSSGSFSALDIDAATGDAALRFQKAGVNQWNVRNRPADDYFEIFELGGGGSRVVIQDGTGNFGIGETTNPVYKLDVLHGGATGIRSRSSGTFSVVDIDGANGDAALRFQRAGVNQWNTRNNPATDDYQIFELGGGGERMRIDNTTGKVWVNQDFTVVGVKAFTMDHPLDPANKLLMHAAAESNEVINFYSGNITTDANGKAVVSLPDYYEALNKDSRYQLTVIGSFAQAIISKEVSNNKFEIATSIPNVKVSWEVKGVRNDNRMKMHPFVAEEMKSAAQIGKYVDPASHNQPASKGISYDPGIDGGNSSLNDINLTLKTAKVSPATTGGSLDQAKITPPAANPVEKGGSLDDIQKQAPSLKKPDTSGSVAPVEKKQVTAPVIKSN